MSFKYVTPLGKKKIDRKSRIFDYFGYSFNDIDEVLDENNLYCYVCFKIEAINDLYKSFYKSEKGSSSDMLGSHLINDDNFIKNNPIKLLDQQEIVNLMMKIYI